MKKWILLALLVLVVYSSYTLFIKVTHFTTEKASFEYNAGNKANARQARLRGC